MNRAERVMNAIRHQPLDYLPSHIAFADRSRQPDIEAELRIGPGTLDEYLDNHLHFAYSRFDLPVHFRNNMQLMSELEREGFCKIDRARHIVYDAWGMGINQFTDGFTPVFFPMQGVDGKAAREFMPDRLPADFLSMDIEAKIAAYSAPDADMPGAYDDIAAAVRKHANGDSYVVPAGYWGIFERAYGLRSFEEFMADMAAEPKLVHALLEKVTDFKVADAKKKILAGAKIGHNGDDLATQLMILFSRNMFKELFLPCLKRLFDVYKSAGLPMFMHSCGNITEFIPDLIDIGLDVLEPVQPCMDLAYVKREFGKDLCFWGGIDTQELLPFGTPAQVKEGTRKVIRTLGRDGGYIIGPSQEIMRDVPTANIVAMLETIREERRNM